LAGQGSASVPFDAEIPPWISVGRTLSGSVTNPWTFNANLMDLYPTLIDKFLTKDGFLSKKVMPDYLHPNEAGYKIWAEAIEPKVAELMDEKPKR
jgi:lysophospholipase L1-like esterase